MDKVVHFEVPTDDINRAKKFYSEVFDWEIKPIPEAGYDMITTIPTGENRIPVEPGAINGGLMKRHKAGEPITIVINVNSIDEYLKKIEASGGKTLVKREKVKDLGFYGRFEDTEGNMVGLWEDT